MKGSILTIMDISTAAEVMINNVNITEPVELYEEVVEDDPVENVPSDMIQINANLQEVGIFTET